MRGLLLAAVSLSGRGALPARPKGVGWLAMSVLSEIPAPDGLLTTGQAAKLCCVATRTIARWADAGLLRSHRTVGGRRRLQRSDLLTFMRDRKMPVLAQRRLRIAVIDDDINFVRALLRMLSRRIPDADLRSAHDGFSAGALVASFHPDLVFLDIVMPGLSGIDVCEHIKSTPELKRTAVVIVSGYITAEIRRRLTAAGANRFISKPFAAEDIEAAVAHFVKPATTGATPSSRQRSPVERQ